MRSAPLLTLILCTFALLCPGRAGGVSPPVSSGSDEPLQPTRGLTPPARQDARAKPKLYEGLTLEEWRERIKNLSLDQPQSRAAVPGLLAILKDPQAPWFTRRQAANTLGRLGKTGQEAVPVLVKILDEPATPDHSPAVWAAKSLALFGPFAREATPRLVTLLNDAGRPLAERQVVLETLGQIGGAHPRAIPALVETVSLRPPSAPGQKREEINSLRELAAEALAVVAEDAAIAAPVLLRCLQDPSESLRRKSITALGRIGPSAQLAIPTLVEALAFDESPAVRDAAETALAGIGRAAVPAVAHLLSDREAELRLRAARGLGQMQAIALSAAPKLRPLLEDVDADVRLAAAEAWWQITQQADAALPVLVEMLQSSDRQRRMRAFRLLTEELGSAARPARDELTKLLDDPRPFVRQTAQKALAKIPPTP